MSAITTDWTLPETEAATSRTFHHDKTYRRDEEFRAALDSYIADYAEYQRRRAEMIGRPRTLSRP
jgi:hypothetical protein